MAKETLHIYARVSSSSQTDNTSLDKQIRTGEGVAKTLGMKTKVWNEGAASSSNDDLENRPVLMKLMEEISNGEVKHLYTEYSDRLSRNARTWGVIRWALETNKVLFYSGSDPNPVNLENPTDELIFSVLSSISQFDNRLRTLRLTNGKFQRVSEGKWLGGPPPFGYKLKDGGLIADKNEAKWVKKIYESYADGMTVIDIQTLLRDNGVFTRRGNVEWSLGSIEKVLRNTHYSGYYEVTRKKTNETWRNECPPIISKVLREKVEKSIASRTRSNKVRNGNQIHFYLLTDYLYCGECGRKFRGRINDRQNQYIYFCPAREEEWRRKDGISRECNGVRSVKIKPTDDVVWTTVVNVLEKSSIFKESIKNAELETGSYRLDDLEVERTRKRIKRLTKQVDDVTVSIGKLTAHVYVGEEGKEKRSAITELELMREKYRRERDNLSETIVTMERNKRWVDWVSAFRDRIDSLKDVVDPKERGKFLKEILEKITVSRGGDDSSTALDIRFALPYVDDSIVYKDPKRKSKGYDLKDGKDSIRIVYDAKKNG